MIGSRRPMTPQPKHDPTLTPKRAPILLYLFIIITSIINLLLLLFYFLIISPIHYVCYLCLL